MGDIDSSTIDVSLEDNSACWPRYSIVCGSLRNEEETCKAFDSLLSWRAEGLIAEIVWSTWENEIQKSARVHALIENHGIHVVESKEPSLVVMGNVLHQMKQLLLALQACPDECWVFKARTDKVLPREDHRLFLTQLPNLRVANDRLFGGTFKHKVATGAAPLIYPFCIEDTIYFSSRNTLLHFVNFDTTADFIFDGEGISAEVRFWAHPFRTRLAIFDEYYSLFDPLAKQKCDIPTAWKIFSVELHSDFYLRYLLTFYQILHHYFHVGWTPPSPETMAIYAEPSFSFIDLYDLSRTTEHALGGWHLFWLAAHHALWLEAIAKRRLRITAASERLHCIFELMGQFKGRKTQWINPLCETSEGQLLYRELRDRFALCLPQPKLHRTASLLPPEPQAARSTESRPAP